MGDSFGASVGGDDTGEFVGGKVTWAVGDSFGASVVGDDTGETIGGDVSGIHLPQVRGQIFLMRVPPVVLFLHRLFVDLFATHLQFFFFFFFFRVTLNLLVLSLHFDAADATTKKIANNIVRREIRIVLEWLECVFLF